MELSPKQQIAELIKNSERILILGHKNHGGDLVGSMLALGKVLTLNGKEVSLVLSEQVASNLLFLPGVEKVSQDISGQRDLVISISKNNFPVEKISYSEEDGNLSIIVSPKAGNLTAKDLQITEGNFKYDLIFVLDTPDVEKIDRVYDKYTELFFEVPIVNIDHHSGNEYFGTVNLVDLTATSTAEILVSIIEALGPNNFDADVATCLLTGLISDTASFKNVSTTPKSLTISAQMLAAGARQQEIIQNLYKTRPLNTLKLWGKVLSNINYESNHRLIWSKVTASEMAASGASSESIRSVLDELLASAPGTDVVVVFAEENGNLHGYLKGLNGQDVLSIAEAFGGRGSALSAEFTVVKATLASSLDKTINTILNFRDKQLGRLAPEPKVTNIDASFDEIKAPAVEVVPEHRTVVIEPSVSTQPLRKEVEPLPEYQEEQTDEEPSFEDILAAIPATTEPVAVSTDTVSNDPIENAIISIDNEIETGSTVQLEAMPNIDLEDAKSKDEALQKIGEVMRGYKVGQSFTAGDSNGNQPIDRNVWK